MKYAFFPLISSENNVNYTHFSLDDNMHATFVVCTSESTRERILQ